MVVEVANGYLIALSGRLDVSVVAEVRTVLHGAIDAGSGDLVVGLAAVEVVDATGLGLLLGADHRAKQRDRRLVFRDASPRVLRILRATRLHRVLTLESAAALV
jgi:anti-anti-sigma factor